MARILTITQEQTAEPGTRKQTVRRKFTIGPTLLGFLSVGLLLVLGVMYLLQINAVATKGYQIKNVEERVEQLQSDQEYLKVQVSEQKSLHQLEERAKELNMLPSETVDYVPQTPSAVALRE